jgi:hypothetical protein
MQALDNGWLNGSTTNQTQSTGQGASYLDLTFQIGLVWFLCGWFWFFANLLLDLEQVTYLTSLGSGFYLCKL